MLTAPLILWSLCAVCATVWEYFPCPSIHTFHLIPPTISPPPLWQAIFLMDHPHWPTHGQYIRHVCGNILLTYNCPQIVWELFYSIFTLSSSKTKFWTKRLKQGCNLSPKIWFVFGILWVLCVKSVVTVCNESSMKYITRKKQQCSRTPWHEVTTPWRRAENWWRGDAAVCVSAKTRFQTSRATSPLCGIVWPLPGSQGIKSSLQSPNLDFPLFRSVILPITKYWATRLVWRNITFY